MKIYKRPGLLLLVFYLTISAVWGQKNVKGSGYVLTQQRETADFTSIEISRGIDVAIVRGEMEPITVEADDNLFGCAHGRFQRLLCIHGLRRRFLGDVSLELRGRRGQCHLHASDACDRARG